MADRTFDETRKVIDLSTLENYDNMSLFELVAHCYENDAYGKMTLGGKKIVIDPYCKGEEAYTEQFNEICKDIKAMIKHHYLTQQAMAIVNNDEEKYNKYEKILGENGIEKAWLEVLPPLNIKDLDENDTMYFFASESGELEHDYPLDTLIDRDYTAFSRSVDYLFETAFESRKYNKHGQMGYGDFVCQEINGHFVLGTDAHPDVAKNLLLNNYYLQKIKELELQKSNSNEEPKNKI